MRFLITKFCSLAATEIQRVFRGHLGRERVKYFFYEREQIRQFARFQYFALQLQKCFRGYYSRKYRRNHARRKQYIKDVIDVGEKVRSMLKNYSEEQTEVSVDSFLDSLRFTVLTFPLLLIERRTRTNQQYRSRI